MDILLKALYGKESLNTYDYCVEQWGNGNEAFQQCKSLSDELVEEKLAKYCDLQKTELRITNYGRYWISHGGYFTYLKEGERKIKHDHENEEHHEKEKHHEELKEELKEARLKFTHYRIVTYWWSFALTLISFLLSLLNLYLILNRNK